MDRLVFIKGDGVKYIKPKSKLIPILKEDGWQLEGHEGNALSEEEIIGGLDSMSLGDLRARAKELGIKGAHLAKKDTLIAKISEALED